jgi:hypothetical protein
MSDTDLHLIPDAQKQQFRDRFKAGKDNIILWEEQFISIKNELNAVIATQQKFVAVIDGLKAKAEQLVGDVPSTFGPQFEAHIAAARVGVTETEGFQQDLKKMHDKVNKWEVRLQAAILRLSKEEIAELGDLATAINALPNLIGTFEGFAKKMRDADNVAKASRPALAEAVRACVALATSRLKTDKHSGVYEWFKTGVEVVLGFVQLVDPTLVGESAAAGLKTALTLAADAVQEAESRIRASRTKLDEALGAMGPYTLCKGHLLGLKSAFTAGVDGLHSLEVVPVVGRALQFVVASIGGVVDGFFKQRIDEVDEMEKEMKAKLAALQLTTSTPTAQDYEDLKKEVAEAQEKVNKEWGKVVEGLKGVVPENKQKWVELAIPAFQAAKDATELATKAVERISGALSEVIATKVPHEMPKAVFAFEIKGALKDLADASFKSAFTPSEEAELAALQH